MYQLLVIDDEKDFRDELELTFSKLGFQTYGAGDPLTAVDMAMACKPDILICDWMLQDKLHGLHVIQLIRVLYPHVRPILMTAFPSKDLVEGLKEYELFDFIEKPFDRERMLQAVERSTVASFGHQDFFMFPVVQTDADFNIEYCNTGAMELFAQLEIDPFGDKACLSEIFSFQDGTSISDSRKEWVDAITQSQTVGTMCIRSRTMTEESKNLFVLLPKSDALRRHHSIVKMLLNIPIDKTPGLDIPGNVLVVDDNKAIRRVCAELLDESGSTCFSAATHKEARELFSADPNIKLVIMDYSMPEGSPRALLEWIRQQRAGVIVVGISGQDCRDDFEEMGVGLFLQKPWMLEDLKFLLNGLI